MSENREQLRKISFRLPQSKFDKVKMLVDTREKYKGISDFLRTAVDYRLYLAGQISYKEYKWVQDELDWLPSISRDPVLSDKVMDITLEKTRNEVNDVKTKLASIEHLIEQINIASTNSLVVLEKSTNYLKEFSLLIIQRLREIRLLTKNEKADQMIWKLIHYIEGSDFVSNLGPQKLSLVFDDMHPFSDQMENTLSCEICGAIFGEWELFAMQYWEIMESFWKDEYYERKLKGEQISEKLLLENETEIEREEREKRRKIAIKLREGIYNEMKKEENKKNS